MSGYTYYNDNEHFCCEVLRKNIANGNLPEGYVDERDIREVHASDFIQYSHIHLFAGIGGFPLGLAWANVPTHIRIFTGGFPCQDISNAGKRAGIKGNRSGLWTEMYRILQEAIDCGVRPDYVLIENVAALLSPIRRNKRFEQPAPITRVLADLAAIGFDAEWQVLRASDIGAPHIRERIFIVAYPASTRCQEQQGTEGAHAGPVTTSSTMAHPTSPESGRLCQPHFQPNLAASCTDVANPQSTELEWSRDTWDGRIGFTNSSPVLANTSGARREEWDTPPISGDERHAAWRKIAPGKERLVESSTSRREWESQSTGRTNGAQSFLEQSSARDVESGMGRVLDGLPSRMDGYRWPAGAGEEQYSWEPPRTLIGKQTHRPGRLKALGNAIVPQLIALIGHCINAHYTSTITNHTGSQPVEYKLSSQGGIVA